MNRVVHFEIHAENTDLAIKFYSEIFGWNFQKWEGPIEYWLISTGDMEAPGINGGMIRRKGKIDGVAVIAYVCTIEVENIDKMMAAVEDLEGQIVVPKSAVPGVGWSAYCKDPEGNIFGLMENDPAAG